MDVIIDYKCFCINTRKQIEYISWGLSFPEGLIAIKEWTKRIQSIVQADRITDKSPWKWYNIGCVEMISCPTHMLFQRQQDRNQGQLVQHITSYKGWASCDVECFSKPICHQCSVVCRFSLEKRPECFISTWPLSLLLSVRLYDTYCILGCCRDVAVLNGKQSLTCCFIYEIDVTTRPTVLSHQINCTVRCVDAHYHRLFQQWLNFSPTESARLFHLSTLRYLLMFMSRFLTFKSRLPSFHLHLSLFCCSRHPLFFHLLSLHHCFCFLFSMLCVCLCVSVQTKNCQAIAAYVDALMEVFYETKKPRTTCKNPKEIWEFL